MRATGDLAMLFRRALSPLLLCAIGALSIAAHAAGVAMVTDLQGKATLSSGGTNRDLTICAELDTGTKVQLAAGATLVLLYFDAGDEYVFRGPSTIEFKPGAPEVASGAQPEKRSLSLGKGGKDVRIKPVGITQGAMVMRSVRPVARIQLLTLNKTRTLESSPEFRWSALEAVPTYGFELSDETGRTVFETKVDATSLRLPASVQIREGVPYTWEVSARLPDGKKYASSADFAIAGADLRARAESLRPPANAPLSTRIAYAAWLSGAELKDEARKYWKETAAERPQDARLKALAEQ
ncbi:MAG: hypothetical protein OEW98_03555 [Betaproteobacteria bacterium]|jgi:hypothetical protein|nr:hypothetical protein [Betaproteobacteria bacterium]